VTIVLAASVEVEGKKKGKKHSEIGVPGCRFRCGMYSPQAANGEKKGGGKRVNVEAVS